jgi:hypothetical protein
VLELRNDRGETVFALAQRYGALYEIRPRLRAVGREAGNTEQPVREVLHFVISQFEHWGVSDEGHAVGSLVAMMRGPFLRCGQGRRGASHTSVVRLLSGSTAGISL